MLRKQKLCQFLYVFSEVILLITDLSLQNQNFGQIQVPMLINITATGGHTVFS